VRARGIARKSAVRAMRPPTFTGQAGMFISILNPNMLFSAV
jgi:hypothetical protein